MGKSYRRPYACIFGSNDSAKEDKKLAARGARRLQNRSLKTCEDYEDFLIPHRREASHNDVWTWSRDGRKRLQKPPVDLETYRAAQANYHSERLSRKWYAQEVLWYQRICRK